MSQRIADTLIVALDVADKEEALQICRSLGGKVKIFKVGLQLFLAAGKQIVEAINDSGYRVFLDLKLCDIPHQTSRAVKQIVKMNIAMFTVHTMGGLEMMKQTVRVAEEASLQIGSERPLVLGVTVLTSWSQNQMEELGIKRKVRDQVVKLATLAQEAGLDGIVASPQEVELLRQVVGKSMLIVTPGIRQVKLAKDDQKRTLTPEEAVRAGADYIVIGRPIVCSPNPSAAVSEILDKLTKNT